MINPKQLQKGQTIGIYSPSGSVSYNPAETAMYEKGLDALRARGYKVKEGAFARSRLFHMAASGKDKAADIHALFADDTISALFPSVGGHTASQILPYLDLGIIRRHPKIFVGFSDSAVLGTYISAKTGLVTYHSAVDIMFGFSRFGNQESPMPDKGGFTTRHLWTLLEEGFTSTEQFSKWIPLRKGECKGRVFGGNIKGVQALLGTPFEPQWDGTILYWEAADAPHVVAQVLAHLKNAGVLDKIAGMVIGKVSHLKESFYAPDEVMPVAKFVDYILGERNFPVIIEADIGHDVENIAIPNGREATLSVKDEACSLTFMQ